MFSVILGVEDYIIRLSAPSDYSKSPVNLICARCRSLGYISSLKYQQGSIFKKLNPALNVSFSSLVFWGNVQLRALLLGFCLFVSGLDSEKQSYFHGESPQNEVGATMEENLIYRFL